MTFANTDVITSPTHLLILRFYANIQPGISRFSKCVSYIRLRTRNFPCSCGYPSVTFSRFMRTRAIIRQLQFTLWNKINRVLRRKTFYKSNKQSGIFNRRCLRLCLVYHTVQYITQIRSIEWHNSMPRTNKTLPARRRDHCFYVFNNNQQYRIVIILSALFPSFETSFRF